MKKSIILLATLFFVILMISLIGINTKLLKQGFELSNSTKFMIQVNSLLKDVISLLDKRASFIKDEKMLDLLVQNDWSVEDKKVSLFVNIKIISNARNININRLKGKDTTKEDTHQIYDIIEAILKAHNVVDVEYLLNIILDSKDKDLIPRSNESEIALVDSTYEQGLILSMRQFKKILAYYKNQTDDYSVDEINWKKYISFSGNSVDINYISPELLSYILPLSLDETRDILSKNRPIGDINSVFTSSHKSILDKLRVVPFVSDIKCFVDIKVFDKKAKAVFTYNLTNKKALDVSIIAKY
jgi:hypothetical protein